MSRGRSALIAIVGVLGALAVGLWLGGHPTDLPGPIRDVFVSGDRAVRAQLINEIEDNYYKKIDRSTLDDASLKGIVRALDDPFSHYLSPKEAKAFQQSVNGNFDGVGMTVEGDRSGLKVLNVFPGSPARRVGIRPGDLVVAVNGRSIAGLDSGAATGRIKGPAGTSVRLTVVGAGRRRTLSVDRARIDVPVARGRLVTRGGRKIGVVQLLSFTSGAHGAVRQKIDQLRRRGARGFVLDLRGNGGGLLSEAVLVSSIFIDKGKIVSVRGRERSERTENAVGGAIDPKLPVVVLVNGGTASASEITTGALRDRHRATVVGTRTFGKGLVQEVEPLTNGGVLDLTVANYYMPNGETLQLHKGIRPQIYARDNPRTRRDEALPVALEALLKKLGQ